MNTQKREVQQRTLSDGWTSTWLCDVMPATFDSEKEEQDAIDKFIREIAEQIANGEREAIYGHEASEFRVAGLSLNPKVRQHH